MTTLNLSTPDRGGVKRPATRVLVVASLLALLAAAACSKSTSPTNPYGGGGGGGGTGGGAGTMFNLGPFALDQTASFTFPTAGTFGYHCVTHGNMGMVGTVQVDNAGAAEVTVEIGTGGGFTFTPPTAHVSPGGVVHWHNASNLTNHTVTSNS
jgi:plastocyanin